MKTKGVIIQASARSGGNTSTIVSYVNETLDFDVFKLNEYQIAHYHYESDYHQDDFRELFIKIVENYDCLVFATPIYWYTMSGYLKVFFDRISDFLKHEKHYARALARKKMAVLSCGSDEEIFPGFLMPFEQTAIYLDMTFIAHQHSWIENRSIPEHLKSQLDVFSKTILDSLNVENYNQTAS